MTLRFIPTLLVVLLLGCGTLRTQKTLTAVSVAVNESDTLLAREISEKSLQCLELPTEDEYNTCMAPLGKAYKALRTTAELLHLTQSVLQARGEDSFAAYAPCIVDSIGHLVGTLTAAGVPVPDTLLELLQLSQSYGGRCGL